VFGAIGISGIPVTKCLCTLVSRTVKSRRGGRYNCATSCQHDRKEEGTVVEASCQPDGESVFEESGNPWVSVLQHLKSRSPDGDKTVVTG
jgi:hypothetical protein